MKNTITIVGYTNIPCLKNNQIISYRRKKTYNNKKLKEFKSYVQGISKEALCDIDGVWNTKKQYSMELRVTYGGSEIDIQNSFDIICDSLQGLLYEDDKQIKIVSGEKFFEKNTWKFEIILTIL
tara:strand:+ start:221 stop:592 length:372 start_codon:yes stop_codon:yes gene_type:complete